MAKNTGLIASALVGLTLLGSACGTTQASKAAPVTTWTAQGPWNDHNNERCLDYARNSQPTTETQYGTDTSVTKVAEFASAADAEAAFDDVDLCHVPAAANQFLADLDIVAEVDSGGRQWAEVSASGQFETWDMSGSGQPVVFAAVQQDNVVTITLSYDASVEEALEAAQNA